MCEMIRIALISTLHERFLSNAFCTSIVTLGCGDPVAKILSVRDIIVSILVATSLHCSAWVVEKEIFVRIQIFVRHESLSLPYGHCLSKECMAGATADYG